MKPPTIASTSDPFDERNRRDEAAIWVVRHDRGLSDDERRVFAAWLQSDPRNEVAWRRLAAVWGRFEGAGAMMTVPAASARRRYASWLGAGLAAAAALALAGYLAWLPRAGTGLPQFAAAAIPETRVLADGSLVRLNAGAIVAEAFTEGERRVRLLQGEAYFAVKSDPNRPFVVETEKVRIRAVGTAFGVDLQTNLVDVLVTEGIVQVEIDRPEEDVKAGGAPPQVTAGHRAVVALQRSPEVAPVVVTEVDVVEVNRANGWRGGLLRLGGATLAELAAEFERQTGRRLVLADASLQAMRVGGRFPGNDIEGFVRVLEEHYDVKVHREADGTLVLNRVR